MNVLLSLGKVDDAAAALESNMILGFERDVMDYDWLAVPLNTKLYFMGLGTLNNATTGYFEQLTD